MTPTLLSGTTTRGRVRGLMDQKKLPKCGTTAMYAVGNIFWRYDTSSVLVLETSTMEFSLRPLPPVLSVYHPSRYAIGEIRDDECCLVCLKGLTDGGTPALEVWALNTKMWKLHLSSNSKSWKLLDSLEKWWKREKEILVSQLLGDSTRVRQVCMVINGLALICMNERHTQFVVDLESRSLLGEFSFRGQGYPYQMSWPPVGLAATRGMNCLCFLVDLCLVACKMHVLIQNPCLIFPVMLLIEEMVSTSEGSRGRKRSCSRNGVELLDE